jgi:hypothetical protein
MRNKVRIAIHHASLVTLVGAITAFKIVHQASLFRGLHASNQAVMVEAQDMLLGHGISALLIIPKDANGGAL